MGAEQARDLPIPGRELKGMHFAMDYLTQQNKRNAGIPQTEEPITAKGKRVVIIGGGDTGSDCLGTTHRQGCVEVHQFELLPEPPPQRGPSRRLGRSGRCSFARRMRMKKAATGNGASRPSNSPAKMDMSPSCMASGCRLREGNSFRSQTRTLNWTRILCCLRWVLPDRSRMGCSTASAWTTTRVAP